MIKPNFQKLWSAFPDHAKYRSMKDLYGALGGAAAKNVDLPGFGANGNTCASRMSVALNSTGAPINMALASAVGAKTLGTADGSRIIFRVADFRNYLQRLLGDPVVDQTKPYDDAFHGRTGILGFSVNWQGATGHVALWNGVTYREPSYDNYSIYVNSESPNIRTSRGEFWELQ